MLFAGLRRHDGRWRGGVERLARALFAQSRGPLLRAHTLAVERRGRGDRYGATAVATARTGGAERNRNRATDGIGESAGVDAGGGEGARAHRGEFVPLRDRADIRLQ